MKIIDSNTDFYDYYQNIYRDNNIVFDRRNSYFIKNEELFSAAKDDWWNYGYTNHKSQSYFLLHVGFDFWLIRSRFCEKSEDFSMELVSHWKNYDIDSEVIELNSIRFAFSYSYSYRNIKIADDMLVNAINTNDNYKVLRSFHNQGGEHVTTYTRSGNVKSVNWTKNESSFPILCKTAITKVVEPLAVYLALEEHFSYQKTQSERSESVNLTDKDRITNHGFDLRSSFRNN